jgi:hypothetical protein
MTTVQTVTLAALIVVISSIQVAMADTNQPNQTTQPGSQRPITLKVEKVHKSLGSKLLSIIGTLLWFAPDDEAGVGVNPWIWFSSN